MRISDKGLDLIKKQDRSGGRLPSGPAFDAVDECRVNITEYRQLIGGQTERKSFADNADFAAGQLLRRPGDKASLPLLLGVDGERHPFEVFWPVVGLNAVDVVYGQPICIAWNERSADQSVNEELLSPPVDLDCDDIVTVGLIGGGQYLVRLGSDVRRPPAAGCFVGIGTSPDAASVRHIENTLIASYPIDFFPLFHASPCKNMRGGTVA